MKRKTLTLVLCLLATFALASIGFASWIIASPDDVNITDEGSFTVYNAVDSTAQVTYSFANGKNQFIFGKPTEAEINAISKPWLTVGDEMAEENLSVTINVNESNANYNETLEVYIYVNSDTYTALQAAKTAGLIYYADDLFQTIEIDSKTYYGVKAEGTESISLTLAFQWGTEFNKINPYKYYNTKDDGYDATAATKLNALAPLNTLKFNVLIKEQTV